MKTKKIAAKRFKVTSTGKLLRRRQNARHLRAHKSKKQIHRFKKSTRVVSAMERNLRVFIPYT